MQFYNYRNLNLKVIFPSFKKHRTFIWNTIIGFQFGDYYFGLIKGRIEEQESESDEEI